MTLKAELEAAGNKGIVGKINRPFPGELNSGRSQADENGWRWHCEWQTVTTHSADSEISVSNRLGVCEVHERCVISDIRNNIGGQ